MAIDRASQWIRVLFIIANVFFLVLGLVLLGIGIWLVVTAEDQDNLETGTITAGGALLIVAAAVTLLACGVGIVGAIFLSRIILIIYACLVLLLVILEAGAASIGFAYRVEIKDEVGESFLEKIDDYRYPDSSGYHPDVNNAVEHIQSKFDCCGYTNWTDWERNELFCAGGPQGDCDCVPGDDVDCITVTYSSTMCGFSQTFSVWDKGCKREVQDTLEEHALVLGALAIVAAVAEVLGGLLAIGLCLCVHRCQADSGLRYQMVTFS